jgi:signal transduction histidine kinase
MSSQPAKSILIVEDERIVAKDIQQTLRELGYDAYAIAASADEAIARATEKCPDLVLMDIRIKGNRDGIETAEILQSRFGVPVVYLTAHADEATLDRAKKTQPHGYLLKPVKWAELRSMVEVSIHRHQMEKRLHERERWFEATLESVADAVITYDAQGNVTSMNPVAERLTGISEADAAGRPAREIASTDNLPAVSEAQSRSGVMVFRDNSEQQALQKKLELSDRLASLGAMAAGVAHEVNNPLAVVMANAALSHTELSQLLAEAESGQAPSPTTVARLRETIQAVTEIRSSTSRIARIVADLKSFSRPEEATSEQADVKRTVAWAVRATALEVRHRARVSTRIAEVPPVALDETRLGQVLVNLLINAAHAIEIGSADTNEIAIVAKTEAEQVTIEVTDTGSGMPEHVVSRIFEPFFTTKPVGLGTGLGLSICRGIVSSVGGSLQVESTPGQGSTFRVRLPTAATRISIPPPAIPAPDKPRRGRILVIDDEELVLRVMGRILKDHELVCVPNVREALKALNEGPAFDIIFSDLMMPDVTGMDLYDELLRTRADDARRLVFLSGGALTPMVADFLASVPNTHLEKPFQVDGLRTIVQQLLATRTTS